MKLRLIKIDFRLVSVCERKRGREREARGTRRPSYRARLFFNLHIVGRYLFI